MKEHYHFHHQLVLRTPSWPFTTDFSDESIRVALADDHFLEALYLASPALHEECLKWQRVDFTDPRKSDKLRGALTRYYARATNRCTPFGLFAGCSVLRWGNGNHISLDAARGSRHTRLDMHYLCALARQLAARPDIRPHLRYWPNTSLYRSQNEFRYIEHHYIGATQAHQISAVEASEYVVRVVEAASDGPRLVELQAQLLTTDEDPTDVAEFLVELIGAQVLVSELEPTVTGEEFFHHLQVVLRRVQREAPAASLRAILQVLADVEQQLRALDKGTNTAADYERVMATLAPLQVPVEPGKLFQVDLTQGLSSPDTGTFDFAAQTQLLEALEVLAYLTPVRPNPRLEDFTRRFQARYEDQEVPLLEALDNESGLSYSDYGKSRYSPLVHDLVVTPPSDQEHTLRQSEVQHFMYCKLREAERSHCYGVELTQEELLAAGFQPAARPLPPSLSVMFRPVDEARLLLEAVGGSSAVNLLGRFAHADARIGQLVRQVTQREQAHNPGVAFAEICHLPASRIGNLLQRPCFRALEIPYLAQSALPAAGQVRVQDLTLSIRQDQLVLRSRRTNQVIVPRLSTAHNFAHEALPVYQFLCDLQTQALQDHLGFSWQAVTLYAKFRPRLTYKRVILQAAVWQLEAADVRPLLAAPAAELTLRLAEFRAQWQLPRFFTLVDGDNELFIDAENYLLLRTWLDVIRTRSTIQLKEFLFDPDASPVRDRAGRPYVSQLIALLVRQAPCYSADGLVPAAGSSVQREFAIGSEWLYYRLYCGQLVADRVLCEAIEPLVAELRERGLIDQWFFIRYADPDNHLRVRWHLPDAGRVGEVVRLVGQYLQPFSAAGAVWKIQADTYRRELERYGPRSIELAEALFCQQSDALLDMMTEAAQEPELAESWLWGVRAIDELLTAFDYSLVGKHDLLRQMRDSFAHEFRLDQALKTQLDAKYRAARPAIQQALSTAPDSRPAPTALALIAQQINALDAEGQLEVPKDQLMSSYIHMLLNRLIPADARLHELVLYDFMFRHYQSCWARQRVRN